MKTITRFLGLASIVAIFIFLDACKGEKGDVVPAGVTGAVGANGAIGANGQKGDTGTANVIYSDWMPLTLTGSITSSSVATIQTPKITQEIIDKGVVLSFVKFQIGYFYSLPLSFQIAGRVDERIAIRYLLGTATITTNMNSSGALFRYVVIPEGIAGGRRAAIDYTDYEAVKRYYNLPN